MRLPDASGVTSPVVAAAVIVERGRLLLVRRRIPEGDLVWQLPAGKVELSEDPAQAAVREVAEETGLQVVAGEKLGERVHPLTGRRLVYVVCELVAGTAYLAAPDELTEVRWCDRATVAEHVPYPFFEPVQAYLDELL